MGSNVTYITALVYGFLAFFTPCIIPLLPVYFGYLAGDSINNIETKGINKKLMLNAIGFVLGISIFNVLLGFGFTAVTKSLNAVSDVMRYVGGSMMILFGVYFIFDLKLMFFERQRKLEMKHYSPSFIKSFLLGITFSFGWTPCNGPILASILMIASFQQNYLKAGTLMMTYSAGFATMFLLSALLVGVFVSKANKLYKYFGVFKKVAGALMIGMGILLIINKLNILSF